MNFRCVEFQTSLEWMERIWWKDLPDMQASCRNYSAYFANSLGKIQFRSIQSYCMRFPFFFSFFLKCKICSSQFYVLSTFRYFSHNRLCKILCSLFATEQHMVTLNTHRCYKTHTFRGCVFRLHAVKWKQTNKQKSCLTHWRRGLSSEPQSKTFHGNTVVGFVGDGWGYHANCTNNKA